MGVKLLLPFFLFFFNCGLKLGLSTMLSVSLQADRFTNISHTDPELQFVDHIWSCAEIEPAICCTTLTAPTMQSESLGIKPPTS